MPGSVGKQASIQYPRASIQPPIPVQQFAGRPAAADLSTGGFGRPAGRNPRENWSRDGQIFPSQWQRPLSPRWSVDEQGINNVSRLLATPPWRSGSTAAAPTATNGLARDGRSELAAAQLREKYARQLHRANRFIA